MGRRLLFIVDHSEPGRVWRLMGKGTAATFQSRALLRRYCLRGAVLC